VADPIMANAIDWGADGDAELAQCVRTLIATAPGTVPLARALGTPQTALDAPMNVGRARLTSDVVAAFKRYEPRVKIDSVSVTGTVAGDLTPTLRWRRV
jgi:phage baseplate assembly protein W